MKSNTIAWRGLWLLGLIGTVALLAVPRAEPQTTILRPQKKKPEMIQAPLQAQTYGKVLPRLEAVAETKLIMEGLAHTNFRGLERLLTERPNDPKAWEFARGQALLLAETANLLMLRPPKNEGQAVWFDRTMSLRNTAKELGLAVGARDFDRSRAGLIKMAAVCTSCHQTFRIGVEIKPFERPQVEKVSLE